MRSKLPRLDSIRHTTNTTIVQSDLLSPIHIKLKTSVPQNAIDSISKKSSVQRLSRMPIRTSLSTSKSILNLKSQEPGAKSYSIMSRSYLATSQIRSSPVNDEHSKLSISPHLISNTDFTVDSEELPYKGKRHHDFQKDSQVSEFPYRKYRSTRSITSSSSTSKNSRDEPLLAPDTLLIGKLYIVNELYPSIDHEDMNGTPIAFLGAEKLLRTRVDWTKIQYPLLSYHMEIIIDLLVTRPSFIREIPKVTHFNLYRPLIKTVSGHLFFDHAEHKAAIHHCERKQINRKFTIEDLASIHRREFHIMNYNTTREQRFINLCENLFQIHLYQTKSNYWKTYLIKPQHYPFDTSDIVSHISLDNSEIHHINTLLTINQEFSPKISPRKSTQKRSNHSRRSTSSEHSSAVSNSFIQRSKATG